MLWRTTYRCQFPSNSHDGKFDSALSMCVCECSTKHSESMANLSIYRGQVQVQVHSNVEDTSKSTSMRWLVVSERPRNLIQLLGLTSAAICRQMSITTTTTSSPSPASSHLTFTSTSTAFKCRSRAEKGCDGNRIDDSLISDRRRHLQ